MPKRTKFRKYHKYQLRQTSTVKPLQESAGDFKLRTLEPGRLTKQQLNAMRRAAKKIVKRTAKLWTAGPPCWPVTSKPKGIRMGKGKGAVDYWVAPLHAGIDILEIWGATRKKSEQAIAAAQRKLPVRSYMIRKTGHFEEFEYTYLPEYRWSWVPLFKRTAKPLELTRDRVASKYAR